MIPLPLKPKVVEKKENWARFEIEALYPGYGVMIGNSLRRVLLSSLPGAAVTRMKIKGVPHEFSTISGVLEDVVNIMLNVKQMRFKIFSDEPQKATLKIKGEKTAKGSDFELPSQLELINKNCHIATLTTSKAELEIEITVEKGIGFLAREMKKGPAAGQPAVAGGEKLEIGVIPLDAIFTPMKRVSFRSENMRVGDRTDFDKLFLDIETDGTISPEDAFRQSAEILVGHFSLLVEAFQKEEKAVLAETSASLTKKKSSKSKKVTKSPVKKHAKTKKGKKT